MAAGTAAYGAGFHGELGSTMGDNTMSVFLLAALVLLLLDIGAPWKASRIRWSGLLIGLAAAAKYVAGIYVIGLVAMVLTLPGKGGRRVRTLVNFTGAIVCGVLLAGGYWMILMLYHYQSPVFPFYNALFQSPFAPTGKNFADLRFLPRSLSQALLYPIYIANEQNLVAEHAFRDARLAAAAISLVALGAVGALRARALVPLQGLDGVRLTRLGVFFLASYLVWLKMFSIYRYAVPLELIAAPLVIGTLTYALRRDWIALPAALVVCLVLIVWTKPLNWGRVRWSGSYFNVNAAALESYAAATVLMWDMPNAYLVPFFPESATFLRLQSNWGLTPETLMWSRLRDRVSSTPPARLFFLESRTAERAEAKRQMLRELGLALDLRHCQSISSTSQVHRICAVRPWTSGAPG
jgi:hypothetical protein